MWRRKLWPNFIIIPHIRFVWWAHILSVKWVHGPLSRYLKLRVSHEPGMPGRFPRHRGLVIPTCISSRAWPTCRDACRDRKQAVSFEVGASKSFSVFPAHAQPAILRIWQEVYDAALSSIKPQSSQLICGICILSMPMLPCLTYLCLVWNDLIIMLKDILILMLISLEFSQQNKHWDVQNGSWR